MSGREVSAAEILHLVHGCVVHVRFVFLSPPQKKKNIAEIDFTHLCLLSLFAGRSNKLNMKAERHHGIQGFSLLTEQSHQGLTQILADVQVR